MIPARRCRDAGTVMAVELRSEEAGYASDTAEAVVGRLRKSGVYARPLGNVVYSRSHPRTVGRGGIHTGISRKFTKIFRKMPKFSAKSFTFARTF